MKTTFLIAVAMTMLLTDSLVFAQDTTLTITPGGNVGIGTTSPTERLSLNGNIIFSRTASRMIYVEPIPNSFEVGRQLTVKAGDATVGSFAQGGGDLVLQAGMGYNSDQPGYHGGSIVIRSGANYINGVEDGGAIIFQTGGPNNTFVERVRVLETGGVGIGTTSPDQFLSVNGNASKVGGGSWATFSDRRMKQDINPFSDGLSVLKGIRPVTFRYNGKLGYPTDKTYVGVIAQEIQSVAPYTVDTYRARLDPDDAEETDILRFDGSALTYIAINAIKELDAKVDELQELQKENQNLSSRLAHLEALVKSLAAERTSGSVPAGEAEAKRPIGEVIHLGRLELRFDINRASWSATTLDLTLTEFKIVALLALRAGEDVGYREIYDLVHGKDFVAGYGTEGYRANVRTFIKRIRKKFRDIDSEFDQIHNYAGFGYRWIAGP